MALVNRTFNCQTGYSGYVTKEYLPAGDQRASLKKAVTDMKSVMIS